MGYNTNTENNNIHDNLNSNLEEKLHVKIPANYTLDILYIDKNNTPDKWEEWSHVFKEIANADTKNL